MERSGEERELLVGHHLLRHVPGPEPDVAEHHRHYLHGDRGDAGHGQGDHGELGLDPGDGGGLQLGGRQHPCGHVHGFLQEENEDCNCRLTHTQSPL